MTHKHVEGFISWMCGMTGYGFLQVNVHLSDEILKFVLSMLTALFAGAVGWIGQQGVKRLYKFYKSKIKKDGSANDTDN